MATRTLTIGSAVNAHAYDDTKYFAAIETTHQIKAGDPLASVDVVTLGYLNIELSDYFYLLGRSGGQIGYGGTDSGDSLYLYSTLHGTKGSVILADVFYVDEVNDRVGVGVAAPTAALHIKAGTAAANTGQIKFEASTLLTTPEAGVLEYANDRLYLTNVATQRAIDRTGSVLTSTTTVANTTDETTLLTVNVDANALKAENVLKILANGVLSTLNAAAVATIRAYIGSTLIATNTKTGSTLTDEPWDYKIVLTVRSVGATGSLAVHTDLDIGGMGVASATSQTSTIQTVDTTTSEDITLTIQWSAASASNSMSIYQGFPEFKN